jgi:tetratricopeptide (TPR) repeat protein
VGLKHDDPVFATLPLAQQKKHTFSALVSTVVRLARMRPVVVSVEDAHWIDPTSKELLMELAAEAQFLPVLLILTARIPFAREFLPPSSDVIELTQLDHGESMTLARSVPGAHLIDSDALEHIATISDGIPLFIEQVTLSLLDTRPQSLAEGKDATQIREIPATLRELLSERLDRFPGARRVMQIAATLGRSFSSKRLSELVELTAIELDSAIKILVDATILSFRIDDIYEFRHALLHRAAYESLPRSECKAIHSRIVERLRGSEAGPDLLPPEVMAHHLTGAELFADAINAWMQAARGAVRQYANLEALDHLRRASELTAEIRDPIVRRELERQIEVLRISPLMAVHGFSATSVADCCRRGLALCRDTHMSPLMFPFLYAHFTWSISVGHIAETKSLADLFLTLAERAQYESGRVIGHRLRGMSLFASGDAGAAKAELVASMRLYQAERDDAVTYLFAQNFKVTGQAVLSLVEFYMGDVEQAITIGLETLKIADGLRHPLSTSIAISYVGGLLFGYSGAMDAVDLHARRLLAVADDHNIDIFRSFAEWFLGWAISERGPAERGIALIERALANFDSAGWRLAVPNCMAVLAEQKCRIGQIDEAYDLCMKAKELINEGGECWPEPEVLRVEARVLRAINHPDAAQRTLQRAITLARTREARVFELRCLLDIVNAYGPDCDDALTFSRRIRELAHLPPLNTRIKERIEQQTESPGPW